MVLNMWRSRASNVTERKAAAIPPAPDLETWVCFLEPVSGTGQYTQGSSPTKVSQERWQS